MLYIWSKNFINVYKQQKRDPRVIGSSIGASDNIFTDCQQIQNILNHYFVSVFNITSIDDVPLVRDDLTSSEYPSHTLPDSDVISNEMFKALQLLKINESSWFNEMQYIQQYI